MALYERSPVVDEDWQSIVDYTFDEYGEAQVRKYTQGLLKCMDSMSQGEGQFKDKKVLRRTVRIKHCQKHYIFGVIKPDVPMLVIAIFHERMELMKRLKKRLK